MAERVHGGRWAVGGFVKRARSEWCLRRFLIISVKVYKEKKQKISSSDSKVGPVKFSSSSSALIQRNLANCDDNKKCKNEKFDAAWSRKLDSSPMFDLL